MAMLVTISLFMLFLGNKVECYARSLCKRVAQAVTKGYAWDWVERHARTVKVVFKSYFIMFSCLSGYQMLFLNK